MVAMRDHHTDRSKPGDLIILMDGVGDYTVEKNNVSAVCSHSITLSARRRMGII